MVNIAISIEKQKILYFPSFNNTKILKFEENTQKHNILMFKDKIRFMKI